MYEDFRVVLKGFSSPKELFTHPHKIDPTELVNKEANQSKKPLYNDATSPLSTHTYSLHPPPLDTPESPDLPPPRPCVDAIVAALLASKSNLPGVLLTAASGALFGIYQDWVHQNPGIRLYEGIKEDGK